MRVTTAAVVGKIIACVGSEVPRPAVSSPVSGAVVNYDVRMSLSVEVTCL